MTNVSEIPLRLLVRSINGKALIRSRVTGGTCMARRRAVVQQRFISCLRATCQQRTAISPFAAGIKNATIDCRRTFVSSSSCSSGTTQQLRPLSDRNERNSSSEVIDISDLANQMRQQVRDYTSSLMLTQQHSLSSTCTPDQRKIRMVGILADQNDNNKNISASETYSNMIQKKFLEDGLYYELYRCHDSHQRPERVEAAIQEMNHQRQDVHGILVFYPIFPQRTAGYQHQFSREVRPYPYYLNPDTGVYYKTVDDYLRDCVLPSKDVEGLCHECANWHRQFFRARGGAGRLVCDVYIPCTVTAVLKILQFYHLGNIPKSSSSMETLGDYANEHSLWGRNAHQPNQQWQGSTVTVINRSNILGRPLAALLALEGATVYSIDDQSIIQFQASGRMRRCKDKSLSDCLQESSVVVTAVPGDDFELDIDAIKDNTTVVDVSKQTNVDYDRLLVKPGIRLVPSVGKVTVAALEHNLIRLHRQHVLGSKEGGEV